MARLKLSTAEQHAAIEDLVPLLRPGCDTQQYVDYLRVMHRVHAELEPRLAAVPGLRQALPDFEERRKQTILARDLQALGVSMHFDGAAGAPLPSVVSVAEALGVLYVLEGSTLGGRVLSRHLGETLKITAEHGGAYLASYGDRLGSMWRTFGARVEQWAGGSDPAPLIAAARATFVALAAHLSRATGA